MRVNNFLSLEGVRSGNEGFNLGGQTEASCSHFTGGEQEVDLSDKDSVKPNLQAAFYKH